MKIMLLMLLISLTSCANYNYDAKLLNDIFYIKDSRTNLCFAEKNVGYPNAVLTNVPCTPEVEKMIEAQKFIK